MEAVTDFELTSATCVGNCKWLVAAGLLLACCAGPIGYWMGGEAGLGSVLLAWSSCLLGGVLGVVFFRFFRTPSETMVGIVLGTGARMLVSLAICCVVYKNGAFRPLADAGFVFYLIVLYTLFLVIETVLAAAAAKRPTETE